MMNAFAATRTLSLLACSVSLSLQARAEPALGKAVRDLARYQETVDLCMKSSDYRNLPVAISLEFASISKTINHLENDMHASPKGKLMYISYQFNTSAYRRSIEFRKQLRGQAGGVCDHHTAKSIALKLKPVEALIRRKLENQ